MVSFGDVELFHSGNKRTQFQISVPLWHLAPGRLGLTSIVAGFHLRAAAPVGLGEGINGQELKPNPVSS